MEYSAIQTILVQFLWQSFPKHYKMQKENVVTGF